MVQLSKEFLKRSFSQHFALFTLSPFWGVLGDGDGVITLVCVLDYNPINQMKEKEKLWSFQIYIFEWALGFVDGEV